jgi:hypothetical protein
VFPFGKVERDVDAAGALEFVKERLTEGQAELHRAQMLAGLRDRHHTADAEAGDAVLQTDDLLVFGIGDHHGLAEARQVVAEFCGLVHAKIGNRGCRVELKLVDAVVRLQRRKPRDEKADQGLAVVTAIASWTDGIDATTAAIASARRDSGMSLDCNPL